MERCGPGEKAYDAKGNCIVAVDPRYLRPTEVYELVDDARKAKEKLQWEPRLGFDELVKEMVSADLAKDSRN